MYAHMAFVVSESMRLSSTKEGSHWVEGEDRES